MISLAWVCTVHRSKKTAKHRRYLFIWGFFFSGGLEHGGTPFIGRRTAASRSTLYVYRALVADVVVHWKKYSFTGRNTMLLFSHQVDQIDQVDKIISDGRARKQCDGKLGSSANQTFPLAIPSPPLPTPNFPLGSPNIIPALTSIILRYCDIYSWGGAIKSSSVVARIL